MVEEDVSLRDATVTLELDSTRLVRLGWYLHIGSGDRCIPHSVIADALKEPSGEARYALVRAWLLRHVTVSDLPEASAGELYRL